MRVRSPCICFGQKSFGLKGRALKAQGAALGIVPPELLALKGRAIGLRLACAFRTAGVGSSRNPGLRPGLS